MKNLFLSAAVGLVVASSQASITFDVGLSSWGNNQSFYGNGIGYNVLRTDMSPDSTTAYAVGSSVGTQYVFGFAKESPISVSSYNLATTDLAAATTLKLQFSGISSTPSYIAYTGGLLKSYSYNSSSGTLFLETSIANIAASASNESNTKMTDGFGLIIETDPNFNFGGAVFRTDMFWGDLSNMLNNYPGSSPLAGINANGQHGSNVTFDAYLTTQYLNSLGIFSPADCAAYIQKSNANFELGLTRTLYTASGVDPLLSGVYNYGGISTYNLDGGALDNVVRAEYMNNNWSAGNLGIIVVPEPSTYALFGLGAIGMLMVLRRKKTV